MGKDAKSKSSKKKLKLDAKTQAVFNKKGYEVTDKINEGAFGVVYKAKKTGKGSGSLAAVKVMQISKLPKIAVEKLLPREFEVATTIRHENVRDVFDIFKSNNCFYIFMEFAPHGSLMDHCKKGPIDETQCKTWFKQCTQGLDCMHTKYKICHRDIKPDNVLLDARDVCKLSDFGFAKVMDDEETLTGTALGTPPFYAPELTGPRLSKYNPFLVDIWAMGVMLFIMLNSDWPFKSASGPKDKEGLKLMHKLQVSRAFRHRDGVLENLSEDVMDLINKLLEPEPSKRIRISKMLQHKWLKKK